MIGRNTATMTPKETKKRKAVVENKDPADMGSEKKKAKKNKKEEEEEKNEKNADSKSDGCREKNEDVKCEDETNPKPEKTHKHSAEAAAAWKKKQKLFQKKRMQQPKFFLLEDKPKTNGEPISDNCSGGNRVNIIKRRQPVSLNQVLYLLEYGLLGNFASFRPSWCKLLRVAKVAKVVLIVLNGVTSRVYRRKRHCFPNIASKSVSAKVTPASSYFAMLQDILSHGKSNTRFDLHKYRTIRTHVNEKAAKESAAKRKAKALEDAPAPGKSHYLVSKADREARAYPQPDHDGWVHTNHAETVSEDSPLFGIDCEMVLTSAGSELARVSVIDGDGKVMYNSLVKPENPIRDYLTKYSGMTKALLDPVEIRLADAQREVIKALPRDAILVGQGLENDLRALKLYHPHCVDTSNMFTGSERRVKLKLLAKEYLNRDIQCGTAGHDSVEDALAAIDLFKLKLSQGEKLRNYYREYSKGPVFYSRESIFQVAQEVNKKTSAVDTRCTLKKFKKEPVSSVVCSTDAEICKKARSAVTGSDFVFLQLHGYNNLMQGETIQDEDVEATLSKMDERVGTVLSSLPPNTLHITLMPGSVKMRASADPKKGDYRMRHGRCVVGLKVETIVCTEESR